MPHVRRSMLIWVDADAEHVQRALVDELELVAADRPSFTGPIDGHARHDRAPRRDDRRHVGGDATEVRLEAVERRRACRSSPGSSRIQAWLGARRALPHAAARLDAAVDGRSAPRAAQPLPVVPPVPFTPEQAARLGALAAVALLANFCGALLSQNGDAVTSAFDRSDQALGVALASPGPACWCRWSPIALADRLGPPAPDPRRAGRRVRGQRCSPRSHPTFEVFTGAQLLNRALVQHRAGRRRHRRGRGRARRRAARSRSACSRSRSARASGSRWCCCPLADLGDYGWRISFALSAALVVLVPVIARHLKETHALRAASPTAPRARGRRPRGRSTRLRHALPAARARRVPHQRLQRAVVTAHQPVPHRTRTTSPTPTSRCSAPSPPGSPGSSACCSPAGWPRAAAAGR